jgi:hypothetical protein
MSLSLFTEELSGIFVKSINPGSVADLSGRIQINDQIVEVDGKSLRGFNNHQAVEVLRSTGQVVRLTLSRYLRGPKYDQLQQAMAESTNLTSPTSSSVTTPAVTVQVQRPSAPRTPSPPPPFMPPSPPPPLPLSIFQKPIDLDDDLTVSISTAAADVLPAPSVFLSSRTNSVSSNAEIRLNQVPVSIVVVIQISRKFVKLICTYVLLFLQTDPIQQSSSDQLIDLDRFDPDATAVPLDYSSLSPLELEKLIDHVYSNPISAECEAAIVAKWNLLVDREGVDIVVAQLSKFQPSGGLGISLEGTVDVEEGREVRPHHYIRSILPEGPVGTNGILHSGDELLEVNGRKLLGLSHVEVVAILKELPQSVRMVCARRQLTSQLPSSQPPNDDQERAATFSPRVLPTFFN